jgi:hypothetical protein
LLASQIDVGRLHRAPCEAVDELAALRYGLATCPDLLRQ